MYPWFMESIWWVFKSLYDKGLVYKGFKVSQGQSKQYCEKCPNVDQIIEQSPILKWEIKSNNTNNWKLYENCTWIIQEFMHSLHRWCPSQPHAARRCPTSRLRRRTRRCRTRPSLSVSRSPSLPASVWSPGRPRPGRCLATWPSVCTLTSSMSRSKVSAGDGVLDFCNVCEKHNNWFLV